MIGSSGPINLRVKRREQGLRLRKFGELLCRGEALDRRRQRGVRIGVAIGCAVKLRQRQRGAQLEAARFLRLRDRDRGLQRLLGRRSIGRVALQQAPGADVSARQRRANLRSRSRFRSWWLCGLRKAEPVEEHKESGIILDLTRCGQRLNNRAAILQSKITWWGTGVHPPLKR